MSQDSEKPTQLGIHPVGLGFLGYGAILLVAIGMTQIFNVVRWISEWLGK